VKSSHQLPLEGKENEIKKGKQRKETSGIIAETIERPFGEQ